MARVTKVKFTNNFPRVEKKLQKGVQKGLQVAAWKVIAVTIPLTPKDEGVLRGSFTVQKGRSWREVLVQNTADYAIYVHEMFKNYTIGGAKYLERGVRKSKAMIPAIVALYAKNALRGR